jgi:predicted alpha-1,6-mannanase (GH76 family)
MTDPDFHGLVNDGLTPACAHNGSTTWSYNQGVVLGGLAAIRYLYELWLQSRQPAYRPFILANARSVWDNNTNASHQFGLRWTGPFDRPTRPGRARPWKP